MTKSSARFDVLILTPSLKLQCTSGPRIRRVGAIRVPGEHLVYHLCVHITRQCCEETLATHHLAAHEAYGRNRELLV